MRTLAYPIDFAKQTDNIHIVKQVVVVAITVALASMTTVDAEECGQEEFAKCAEPLEMLHLTSEFSIGAAKKEELDKLCHELRKGVRCIQSYTRRCMDFQQRNQFNKLYDGTDQFIRDLCNKGEFQDVVFEPAVTFFLLRVVHREMNVVVVGDWMQI
uniref:Uncharacterized protein n=1 Tax=Glossina pallidipes TaxID=7398 RepID=A0A1B0A1G5_GLOPL